jgi:hypothetical protein
VRIVLRLDPDRLAVDDPLGDRDAGHRGHATGRPEESAQAGDVVDAEVEQRAAARLVEPAAPVRACPAVAAAGGQQPADLPRAHARMHRAVRGREQDVGRADEVPRRGLRGREHRPGLLQRRRDRLLDQHVLSRLQRRARQPAVLGHAGQHEHDVDVGMPADGHVVRQVGAEVQAPGGDPALAGVGVVDGAHVDAALAAEPLDQAHVRRPERAAAADDAEPDAHVALRAVS